MHFLRLLLQSMNSGQSLPTWSYLPHSQQVEVGLKVIASAVGGGGRGCWTACSSMWDVQVGGELFLCPASTAGGRTSVLSWGGVLLMSSAISSMLPGGDLSLAYSSIASASPSSPSSVMSSSPLSGSSLVQKSSAISSYIGLVVCLCWDGRAKGMDLPGVVV